MQQIGTTIGVFINLMKASDTIIVQLLYKLLLFTNTYMYIYVYI